MVRRTRASAVMDIDTSVESDSDQMAIDNHQAIESQPDQGTLGQPAQAEPSPEAAPQVSVDHDSPDVDMTGSTSTAVNWHKPTENFSWADDKQAEVEAVEKAQALQPSSKETSASPAAQSFSEQTSATPAAQSLQEPPAVPEAQTSQPMAPTQNATEQSVPAMTISAQAASTAAPGVRGPDAPHMAAPRTKGKGKGKRTASTAAAGIIDPEKHAAWSAWKAAGAPPCAECLKYKLSASHPPPCDPYKFKEKLAAKKKKAEQKAEQKSRVRDHPRKKSLSKFVDTKLPNDQQLRNLLLLGQHAPNDKVLDMCRLSIAKTSVRDSPIQTGRIMKQGPKRPTQRPSKQAENKQGEPAQAARSDTRELPVRRRQPFGAQVEMTG